LSLLSKPPYSFHLHFQLFFYITDNDEKGNESTTHKRFYYEKQKSINLKLLLSTGTLGLLSLLYLLGLLGRDDGRSTGNSSLITKSG
jgi:hypothetical protein